ncbi:MAG: hypothetical protein ACR2QR_01995 [Woeseiaceae bacterium]
MTERKGYLAAATALLLLNVLPVHAAEEDTIQAIIPWDAEGRVFQVDTGTMMFLGAMHGVMYVQSSRGEIHEAFVMCPVTQKLDIESGDTEASAHCEITASADDVAYAELSCDGKVGDCTGTFTLVDGEGRFAGISGSGSLRVRSPLNALMSGVAAGADIRVGSGLLVIEDLEYRIP